MIPPLPDSQLMMVGLLGLCVMRHYVCPQPRRDGTAAPRAPAGAAQARQEPTPFVGLTQRPHGALGAHEPNQPDPPSPS